MEKGLHQPNILHALRGDAAALRPEELIRLRALGRCDVLIRLSWAELEPEQGRYDEAAFARLREGLIRLGALGLEPVLCLFDGEGPGWFARGGGWDQESNLGCSLRFVGKVVRSVGHLADRYATFYEPNAAALRDHALTKGARRLSHMACVHIRAYRLIHDMRDDRRWDDTRVGFVYRVTPPRLFQGRAFTLVQLPVSTIRDVPLRAMARGEFAPPLRNVLRVQPGTWCDFVGLSLTDKASALAAEKLALQIGMTVDAPVWLADNG